MSVDNYQSKDIPDCEDQYKWIDLLPTLRETSIHINKHGRDPEPRKLNLQTWSILTPVETPENGISQIFP